MHHHNLLAILVLTLALTSVAKAQVEFSSPGGFYQEAFDLSLSAAEGLAIHYTTDGSTPTIQSPLYSQPLTLSPSLYSTRDIYLIPDAPDEEWNPPTTVRHAIVLRAAAFDQQGALVGDVVTNTYLIASLLGHQFSMPVVSIALDPSMLFDPDSGIFSPNGFSPLDDFNTGNFNQHGREWERLASVEYYNTDNSGFSQSIGIRVHGGKTRRYMQKPLKLYARKEYGNKNIRFPLFDELPYTTFKRLVLKPFYAAWTDAGVQDLLASRIARPLRHVSLASRPVTLFLNGEYWGIYFLQEAPDERLIEQLDDVDADDVNIMGSWYGQVENGSNTHFLQMMEWLETADLSDSLQYQHLTSLVDIDDFIDYQLMEGFDANYDWPANNMRCYQYENSLWRWILYDGDAAFGAVNRLMDEVMTYQGDDLWPSCSQATLLLRRCLQSPQFMERFGNRLYQLYSTTFAYSSTSQHLRLAQQEVAPEVTWQSERFHMPTDSTSWLNAIEQIDDFLRLRPNYFVQQMERLILTTSEGEHDYHLFPNPAHQQAFLQVSGSSSGWVQYLIYDMNGRQVKVQSIFVIPQPTVFTIDLSDLAAGVYVLRLSSSNMVSRLFVF